MLNNKSLPHFHSRLQKSPLGDSNSLVIVTDSKNLTWRQQLFYKLIGMTFLP